LTALSNAVSRGMTLATDEEDNDNFTIDGEEVLVGFKSHAYRRRFSTGDAGAEKESCSSGGVSSAGRACSQDVWCDAVGNRHISIQAKVGTGTDAFKNLSTRVSANKKSLVLEDTTSDDITDPREAFSYTRASPLVETCHPKHIARQQTIKNARKSDPSRHQQSLEVDRTPLESPVRHMLADKGDGDPHFFGKKIVEHTNGEVYVHVGLVADKKDGCVPRPEDGHHPGVPPLVYSTKDMDDADAARIIGVDVDVDDDKSQRSHQQRVSKRPRASSSTASASTGPTADTKKPSSLQKACAASQKDDSRDDDFGTIDEEEAEDDGSASFGTVSP